MQPPVYSKVTQCGNFLRHQLEVYIRKPPHRISQKKEEEQAKKTSKITSTSRQERKRDIEKTPTCLAKCLRAFDIDLVWKTSSVWKKKCSAKCAPSVCVAESVNVEERRRRALQSVCAPNKFGA